MSKHTHRGHCQICLRIQAIDMATGLVAKHGYNVNEGYFKGTCPGSNLLSLHMSRERTNEMIAMYLERAQTEAAKAEALKAGTLKPVLAWDGTYAEMPVTRNGVTRMSRGEQKLVPFAEVSEHYQQRAVALESLKADNNARHALLHKQQMQEWAAKIFDKQTPAYRVEDLEVREWQQGDVVRIGGKSGFDATIEAIEDRNYTTRGFRRGSETIMCPHARITRPQRFERRSRTGIITHEAREAKTYWEPLRNIKRPKSPLIQQLKKAGLL